MKLILKPPKSSKNTVEEMGVFFADLHKLVSARESLSPEDKTMCFELVLDDN